MSETGLKNGRTLFRWSVERGYQALVSNVLRVNGPGSRNIIRAANDCSPIGKYRDLVVVDMQTQQKRIASHFAHAVEASSQLVQIHSLPDMGQLDGISAAENRGVTPFLSLEPRKLTPTACWAINLFSQVPEVHLTEMIAPEIDHRETS